MEARPRASSTPSATAPSEQQPTLGAVLQDLHEVLPGRQHRDPPRMLKGFQAVLRGYRIADIEAASHEWMRRERFFPTPADIVQTIDKLRVARARERRDAELQAYRDIPVQCLEPGEVARLIRKAAGSMR